MKKKPPRRIPRVAPARFKWWVWRSRAMWIEVEPGGWRPWRLAVNVLNHVYRPGPRRACA